MLVISTKEDIQLWRAKMSLSGIYDLIQLKKMKMHQPGKIYRLALAYRFSLCYLAFLEYVLLLVGSDESVLKNPDMSALLIGCRQLKLFNEQDELTVRQMSMLYTNLVQYETGYESITSGMINDVPRYADFLDQIISVQRAKRLQKQGLEALRQKGIL